jgi:hypothetical protein
MGAVTVFLEREILSENPVLFYSEFQPNSSLKSEV